VSGSAPSTRAASSPREAVGELTERTERRQELEIRPLTQTARDRYVAQWNELHGRFVDRPQVAVVEADGLITHVMADRGYPVEDFEPQSELVSVDHPDLVQNYRDARGIYTKTTTSEASTEDLRRAVIAYRALFEEVATDGNRSDNHARS
jgi:hypothetical protein